MMYWIVFALFTSAETFTDVFLSFWFPFYYEIKIILVLWLLSPATKGSSILYRKFVHPMLSRREQDIDECIAKAKEQGYHTVVQLGTKGMNYATTVLMQTAIKVSAALYLCVCLEHWWRVGVITGRAGDETLDEVSQAVCTVLSNTRLRDRFIKCVFVRVSSQRSPPQHHPAYCSSFRRQSGPGFSGVLPAYVELIKTVPTHVLEGNTVERRKSGRQKSGASQIRIGGILFYQCSSIDEFKGRLFAKTDRAHTSSVTNTNSLEESDSRGHRLRWDALFPRCGVVLA
uniref:Receptor expression-enhancing protein n=1 Tax=Timema douglasi TaxID=61478 RepID=A0A7R8ZCY1_TIMDO|nr:unnamed protein product [Timema douglasi]